MAVTVVLLGTVGARAVEPTEEFLAGLRERGLDELTLDYLARMEKSPLADAQFKRRIPYHRGVSLIEISRRTVDPEARSRLLDQARAELVQFADANPDSVLAAEANVQLANVLVERARQSIARAEQLPDGVIYDADRRQHYEQARNLLDDARELFQQAEETYSAELKTLSDELGVAEQDGPPDQRREYRGRLAQVRVLAAQTQFDKAQTYPEDSPSFRRLNEAAAKELGALYESYSRWLVGLYAHLYEGRCYQALGDCQRALGCYQQLIAQPSVHPDFRRLIASAYRYQAECFLRRDEYDAAIASCTAWLGDAQAAEVGRPEWLAIRFRLAEALQRKAETLGAGSAERKRFLAEAAEAYRLVGGSPGEFQLAAHQALADLAPDEKRPGNQPRDFMAAYEAGKAAIASANAAQLALPSAKRNSPSAVPELHEQMQSGMDDARHNFRLATTLVDDETDLALLNEVRYFLCWLYWENGDYYRAAVLGEFLARRYPDHSAAASAAKIAMASYERLYQAAQQEGSSKDPTEFEARRMAEMAQFITRRWPATPDADAAFSVLVSYAIRNGRTEEAEQLLAEASPRHRAELELQLGNAMWSHYLDVSRLSAPSRPDEATLEQLKRDAVARLESGFESARKSTRISEATATAALYLAQALLSDGKYRQAIALLDDRQVGPLTLVSRGNPAASRPGYEMEVYKAALRAYVSVSPPQAERALEVMEALEATLVDENPAASDELMRIYLGLGRTLRKQLKQLRDAGRDEEAAQISAAFMRFLDQLDDRQQGVSWAGRQWIAQTYYDMGEELAGSGGSLASAQEYFAKARNTYQQMLTMAEAPGGPSPPAEAVLVVRKRLGDCLRKLGQYRAALDTFSDVLKEKETWLAAQYAAALTYQQRGQAGDAKWLERAIYGGYRLRSTGENRIWGWLKLAQVANRASRADPKHRDMFFDARLQAARCRYLVAMKSEGAARQQHLTTAKQNIHSIVRLYPDLGGPRWKEQFDRLLKKIQQAAGEQSVGLAAFAANR